MGKILEKSLMDAQKEGGLVLGRKQVRASVADSKMIVISRSADGGEFTERITSDAKDKGVPVVHFGGTSVALGRMCGLQFRTSVISFSSLAETNANAIMKEADSEEAGNTPDRRKR